MNLPVIVNPLAEQDIREICDWYDSQREGLGEDFLGELASALRRIEQLSRGYPKLHRDIRRTYMRRFPYGIFYRVDDSQITVVAVYHSSRELRGWQERE